MSVRNRLALVLAAVLLPLLVGAGLVVAVVVPAQLRTEAAERLEVAASSVAAMQVQSCLGVGDAARVMVLAVAAGEPADTALASGLQRRHGYGWILRDDTVLARSAAVPDGLPVSLTAASRCSAGSVAASGGAGGVPDTGVPALADSVSVPTDGGTLSAVAGVLVDRTSLAAWDAGRHPDPTSDVAVACPGGSAVSTASGSRDRDLTRAARQALAGRAAAVPDSLVRTAPAGEGHPCVVVAVGAAASSAAGSWVTWALLGLSLVLGAVLVAWLSRQLTLPVLAITGAAERAAHGDLAVRLPVGRRRRGGAPGRELQPHGRAAGAADGRPAAQPRPALGQRPPPG